MSDSGHHDSLSERISYLTLSTKCAEMGLSILQFPNEILIHIISQVSNADLDSFTLTCKRIRALATAFIREHRSRQEVYREITLLNPHCAPREERTTWSHPTLMLLDLLRDDLLCYPWVFNITDYVVRNGRDDLLDVGGGDSDSDSEDGTDHSEVDRALKSSPNELGSLIEACPHFNGDEELSRGVLEGGISTTLGLLLNVLPNLRTWNIMGPTQPSPATGILKRILDKMLTTNQNPPRGSSPSLAKLESVVFDRFYKGDRSYDKWNLSAYAPLFYFPSVRNIWAKGLEESDSEDSWTYPGLQSHVQGLALEMSTMHTENFKSYLKSTQNLMSFKYIEKFRQGSRHSGCEVKEVLETLLEHAGHTLRHLNVQCWEVSEDHRQLARAGGCFLGSLKAFRVLETIQVQGNLLIEPVETREMIVTNPATARRGRACRLIDILPSSVARFMFIRERYITVEYGLADMLRGLPERKADLLPHLEVIAFCRCWSWFVTAAQVEFLDACIEAGITTFTLDEVHDKGERKYGFGWAM
ncbi:MAG: hypothetical protein HETSPECPRED_002206 [Heterodermia speciosa]|uniref:F-box domain-containing protein n=1 Tax=Heterodermia speciosa TaxID=116794 RepID=A0A8H3J482_9LECA|nr:MAG: hypothetical protein HETSPECPRED_002206 [Heterodermia speciosa]